MKNKLKYIQSVTTVGTPMSYRMGLLLTQRTPQRQARRKTVTLPQTFMNIAFRQLRKQHLIVF